MDDRDAENNAALDLMTHLDVLKDVERRNPLSTSGRRERTAEHCWHLAMATFVWAPLVPEPVDIEHAVTLAVVHDFPELFTGDEGVYSAAEESRRERESRAMTDFVQREGTSYAARLASSWEEFEWATSPEARLVGALDILLPILLNHANQDQSSWRLDRQRDGITAARVRKRIETVRQIYPWLADRAEERVADAVTRGALLDE